MKNYYPLAEANEWSYRQKDGSTYTNKITCVNGNCYTMHNSAADKTSIVKTDGSTIFTDALEPQNFQPWLSNEPKGGDSWAVIFKANGLVSMLVMTVKATGINKMVEGREYTDVLFIEAENKIIVNDTLMPLNFFTQYYYAHDVGLVLTTSSAGDMHALVNYQLQ